MAKKQAAVAESMAEDVEMTPEEDAELKAEETGEPAPEPVEAEEPEAQLPELPSSQPKAAKHKEETVPIERMEQLNERLRLAEQRAQEAQIYRDRWEQLEARQRQAQEAVERQQAIRAQQELAKQRPDPELDPGGARAWDAEQRAIRAEYAVQQMQQQLGQWGQQQQAVNANNEMQSWLAFQVPQARARFADYDTRVDYARAARTAWWSSVFQLPDGRQVQLFSPEVAQDITAREELVLLNRLRELGIPVAEGVVRLSDSWGYRQWAAQQGQANGQVRRAAAPQLLPSGNQRLEQLERGQAVQGLGRVQSGEMNGNLSWQTMNNAEFKAFVANMPEDQYIDMIQDPRSGKLFERRVGQIDLTDLSA